MISESPEQNILEAAQRMDKYIKCITMKENSDHPYVLLLSKILGFNGFTAMDSAELIHFIELRDNLQRDAGSAAGDEVMLFKAVDFVKRNFKAVSYYRFIYFHQLINYFSFIEPTTHDLDPHQPPSLCTKTTAIENGLRRNF